MLTGFYKWFKNMSTPNENPVVYINNNCPRENIILLLPLELQKMILNYLDFHDLRLLSRVSTHWNEVVTQFSDKLHVPLSGLDLWLDASERSTITLSEDHYNSLDTTPDGIGISEWRSIFGTQKLLWDKSACKGRFGVPTHEIGRPVYMHSHIAQKPAVFFDYGHTGSFCKSVRAHTIISVHTFEVKNRANHILVHKAPGDLCNFYIFTDRNHYYMHSNNETAPNNLSSPNSHRHFANGSIRINGNKTVPVKNVKRWTDAGFCVATLLLNGYISDGLTSIGSDRNCHHFCGSIAELLVYSRKLEDQEIRSIEGYLLNKYQLG